MYLKGHLLYDLGAWSGKGMLSLPHFTTFVMGMRGLDVC
jgi:hypothetical protein